jgi:hypothetical protein
MRAPCHLLTAIALLLPPAPARAQRDTAPPGEPEPTDAAAPEPAAPPGTTPLSAPEPAPTTGALAQLRAELEEQKLALEELRLEQLSAPAELTPTPQVHLYGFMDAGLQKSHFAATSPLNILYQTRATTFVLGNLHLYVDARARDTLRALFEVRLTNQPHGSDRVGDPVNPYQRTSTNVFDPTAASGGWSQLRWGSIVLERAYIEWSRYQALTVRLGAWATPYGIWNIDHGTPTLISLTIPQFVVEEFFPSRQIGLQIAGSLSRPPWEFGYNAYVSNGRTPGQVDMSEDKMLGGRLYARSTRPFHMTFGTSFMAGSYSDRQRKIVQFAPHLQVERDEVIAYDEKGVAADRSVDVGRWRLRGELILTERIYEPGKREPSWIPGSYWSNYLQSGGYVLAAYQLPWWHLEPYLYVEHTRRPTALGESFTYYSPGLNVHFTSELQLKSQYMATVVDAWPGEQDHGLIHLFATRLVLAF